MRRIFAMVLVALMVWAQAGFAATTQVDALIKKLVDKGILTQDEGDQLKNEVAYDEKTLREENVKKDTPEWVQNTKLSGDLRVRHQYEKRNDSTDLDRNRGRIRARLNIETKINDKVKGVFGIATDGGNPRSNNLSFGSTFAKGNVVVNKVYGQYTPNDRWTLTAGKMDNPIWEPMEFLWDGDITPEGGAVRYDYKLNDSTKLFLLGTAFQLSESASNEADPFMYVLQGGTMIKLGEKVDVKLTGMFNGADNIDKTTLSNRPTSPSNAANTTNGAGQYVYHYSQPVAALEVGFNDPLGEDFPVYIPRVGFFGEYTKNPSPDNKNVAWMAGGYMGNAKVNGWKTWKITSAYKVLGADAWLDAFPDSDFYGGATDTKGYESILEVGLAKNVSFVVDYYRTERVKAAKAQESVLQTDINFKF